MTIKKKIGLTIKIVVDVAMIVLFLLLMGYHLFQNVQHEWFGASVFALFLLHNALNWRWYKNLFKGKYTAVRTFQTVVNFLLWITMLLNIARAVMLSRDVFRFLGLSNGSVGRKMHLAATIWSFLLISIHFGMHFQMFIGMAKKAFHPSEKFSIAIKWLLRAILLVICVYGIIVFIQRELYNDMFLLVEFKFMDFNESKLKFFADYIAVFILFSAVGYYLKKLLSHISLKRKTVIEK